MGELTRKILYSSFIALRGISINDQKKKKKVYELVNIGCYYSYIVK